MLATIRGGGGGGGKTRSGTEKRCSHNLRSGHPAADNYSIFPTVNIIRSKKRTGTGKSEMLKKLKKKNHIIQLSFSCTSYLYIGTEMRKNLKRNRVRS